MYDHSGEVEVTRQSDVTHLELPIKRAKGSSGNISIAWSVQAPDDIKIIWPENGMIDMQEGQWNSSIRLSVAGDKKELSEQVVWVQLDKTNGGALLASRDKTRTKIVIAANLNPAGMLWVIVGASAGAAVLLVIVIVLVAVKLKKQKSER